MTSEKPAIVVRDLTLRAGSQVLLEKASIEVDRGELVLLVGASGTGKSLTLALLAGLLGRSEDVQVRGNVRVLGHEVRGRRRVRGVPGTSIVFQDFALFDDLTARDNLRFGRDHGKRRKAGTSDSVAKLLDEFRLPARRMPAQMSGGMRQRLALARAMAYGAQLLFYDEPTSGLDPAMSRIVAERIREVHDRHGMTSVVVTHDLPSLLGIADRVVFLDPVDRCYRSLRPDEASTALDALRDYTPPDDPGVTRRFRPLHRAAHLLEGIGGTLLGTLSTAAAFVPRFPRLRWGLHYLWRAFRLTSFGTALPFMALAGLIIGFVAAFFMYDLLPYRGYTEPVLAEEFLGSLGYALYRVVVPGLITILFAARSGAAAAADIGNRTLTRQMDALRSHGIAPSRYFLTSLLLSSTVGIVMLFAVAWLMTRFCALGVYLATHPGHGAYAFDRHFESLLGTWQYAGPFHEGTQFVLGKLLLSAIGTMSIAYHVGIRPKRSGSEVAIGVTSTILRATIFVLLVHMAFAMFEF